MSLSYPLRLLAFVLVYVLSRFAARWLVLALPRLRNGPLLRIAASVQLWAPRLGLDEFLRLAYYVLVPFAVLQLGWVSPVDLGLVNLDWVRGIGVTVALTVAALGPLVWIWWRYLRLVEWSGDCVVVRQWAEPWGWTRSLREAVLLEASWALIRSAGLVALGGYWGVCAGLSLILVSVLIDPRALSNLRTVGRREESMLHASLVLATSALFWLSGNLWLCCLAHAALRCSVLSMVSRCGVKAADRGT